MRACYKEWELLPHTLGMKGMPACGDPGDQSHNLVTKTRIRLEIIDISICTSNKIKFTYLIRVAFCCGLISLLER